MQERVKKGMLGSFKVEMTSKELLKGLRYNLPRIWLEFSKKQNFVLLISNDIGLGVKSNNLFTNTNGSHI